MTETTAVKRIPRGSVGVEDLITQAMLIADREGLAALTMRRLAADLGVGVTTLYGHVRHKDQLIELVVEAAVLELPVPEPSDGTWDERLERLFTDLRELLWRHPSVLYAERRPLTGPGALRALDATLAMLRPTGLSADEAVAATSTLLSYTFGSALFRLSHSGEGRPDYERTIRGVSPEQLPQIAHYAPALLERGAAAEFAAGLRLIIDGLVRQAAEKRSS